MYLERKMVSLNVQLIKLSHPTSAEQFHRFLQLTFLFFCLVYFFFVRTKKKNMKITHLLFHLGMLSSVRASSVGETTNEAQERRRLTSTCYRWKTFGSAGINTPADLDSDGWTYTANRFNNNGFERSDDWLQFFRSGSRKGYIEKELPEGGDFVRVRYGNVLGGRSTQLQVGGSLVGTATDDADVTTDADYMTNDYVKVTEMSGVANIWSIDICNYSPPGSCFHGDGTVLLESGTSKRLSELSLGERIKTNDGRGGFSFNPVLTLPHANNTEPAAFITLTTETGKKVDMTSDHFIPKCNQEQVTVGALVVGDCLLTVDGKETLIEISSTAKYGVFTAITQDKFIVVDGIVASPFSKDSDPAKPELDYEKYRVELKQMSDRRLALSKSKLNKRLRAAHE